MQTIRNMTVRCPHCNHPFTAAVENIIDVAEDPQAKARLLSGQLNAVQCPNCGNAHVVATPLLYHDASKEMLITFTPMELGLPEDEAERMIGGLMRELTTNLPNDAMKGYIFRPRSALTMQGLLEQVLEGDGITREMMDEGRERSRLVEIFIQMDEDTLPALVTEHDAKLDAQFFQVMSLMAQRMVQEGRPDIAERVIALQQRLVELSTYGQEMIQKAQVQEQVLHEIAAKLQALGPQVTPDQVVDLVLTYKDDDERLQAMVGLARRMFDYNFFQTLTERMGQAPADERDDLGELRERLLQLTSLIDQQAQMALQQSANFLREVLQNPQPEQMLAQNVHMLDDTLMEVLGANIREAQRSGDLEASARLKTVHEAIVKVLQDTMDPPMRFVNDLLSSESEETATELLNARAAEFGPELLDIFDTLQEAVQAQGDANLAQRLGQLREMAEKALS